MKSSDVTCRVALRPGSENFSGSLRFQIIFGGTDFDPYTDWRVTLAVLQKTLTQLDSEIEAARRRNAPQRELYDYSDKRELLQGAITQIETTNTPKSVAQATSRKDKAIGRKLRRKAAKLDSKRKKNLQQSDR